MRQLQLALAVWLATGTVTNGFLKKVKDKDKINDNNGWAQFGFGQQSPHVPAYRPPIYAPGPHSGFAPHYPSYQSGKSPFGFFKGGGSPLLGKYNQASPFNNVPVPYPLPIHTKFPRAGSVSKFSDKPHGPAFAPHTGRYIYPSAYLPAYYMRLEHYGYPPAPPAREPLLSKISKLGKFRKDDYSRGGYAPFPSTYAYGQLGQGQSIPLQHLRRQQQPQQHPHQGFPVAPAAAAAGGYAAGVAAPYPRGDGKLTGTASTHLHPCDHDRYHDVGGKWTENDPYKYTGHHFGVPLKDNDVKNNEP